MADEGRLRKLEEKYEGFTVYDNEGSKIGKVDDLLVDESDQEEYVGVKMGPFGFGGATLIPMDIVSVDERGRTVAVAENKRRIKDAPNFGDDDEVTREHEDEIRRHFGLEPLERSSTRGSYERRPGSSGGDTGVDLGTSEETGAPEESGRPTRVRRRIRREEVEDIEEESQF